MSQMADKSTPLVSETILNDRLVLLVENLSVENVLPGLKVFLSCDDLDVINSHGNRGKKIMALVSCLNRKTSSKSYGAFNAFLEILAGTQPELFKALVGRAPSQTEMDTCIEEFSKEIRDKIRAKGHTTDSPLDEQIDLDTQHVQLQIIRQEYDIAGFARTETEALYYETLNFPSHDQEESPLHKYQQHLSDVENRGGNIPACDILNGGEGQEICVLLSGRAGVGKTTTLQWLARKWALNSWGTKFALLFILQLRMLSNTDTNITITELLALYGLFQLTGEVSHQVLSAWLRNAAGRVVILVDGLDEIANFSQKLINCPKITDLNQRAHPIDLCINIVRGHLLPECTVICTSRPFTGLSSLRPDTELEVLGLTQTQVREYVEKKHPERAKHIMSVLNRNPLLMSVCGITFYCMAVSTLLSEGVEMLDEDVQTYTRLISFIIVQYVKRKLSDWPFVIQVRSYFPKLAHLAENGIFQTKEYQGLSKLVFDEYDLSEVGLTPPDLESVKKGGILQIKEMKTGKRNCILAEFLHLTMQEILAVAHLLSKPLPSKEIIKSVFSDNQFNMALMYMFGLQYDKCSDWIKDVCKAVSPHGLCIDSDNSAQISEFLKNLCSGQDNKLLACQLVHESQMEEQAKSVVSFVAPDSILDIRHTPMTAIDAVAVSFVCQFVHSLEGIALVRVNADDTIMNTITSSLIQPNISSLVSLDVSNNNIGKEGAESLAKTFQESQCLKSLDISENNLGDDGAKVLAEALQSNNSLEALNVSGNEIGELGVEELAIALSANSCLQVLIVSAKVKMGNDIEDMRHNESRRAMLRRRKKSPTPTHCLIGTAGVVSLCDALINNHTLRELHIPNIQMSDNGASALARLLHNNNSLKVLDVSHNDIGVAGSKALLAQGICTWNDLQVLKISHNSLRAAGSEALAEALLTNNSLQVLDISYNGIRVAGSKALAQALYTNSSLQRLDVSGNEIGDNGVQPLAEALHANKTLVKLHVQDNRIQCEGAHMLSKAIEVNQTLYTLSLRGNKISDSGAQALAQALHTNVSLTKLDVGYGKIKPHGAKALAAALYKNKCLQKLDLSHNHMGVEGAKALAGALCTNKTLKKLGIKRNNIGAKGASALAEAVRRNEVLSILVVDNFSIGDQGEEMLREVCKQTGKKLIDPNCKY